MSENKIHITPNTIYSNATLSAGFFILKSYSTDAGKNN